MFEIGFPELVLIAIVGLLVIGPERLPEALRTLGLWLGRLRRSFLSVKTELEKEIGMDEIRRQLHNEAVLEEMKRIEREARGVPESTQNGKDGSEPVTARDTTTAGDAAADTAAASQPPANELPDEASGGPAATETRRDG